MPLLRPMREDDVGLVLDLNHRNVEALAPMDEDRLRAIEAAADRFDVVEVEGDFAGFVVTFTSGTSYSSENYRWFGERWPGRFYPDDFYPGNFYYLDRIVLEERFRRRGLGSRVYDEIEAVAAPYRRLALEVNLRPRNDASLTFHRGRGFVEVGRIEDDAKTVSLMSKELP